MLNITLNVPLHICHAPEEVQEHHLFVKDKGRKIWSLHHSFLSLLSLLLLYQFVSLALFILLTFRSVSPFHPHFLSSVEPQWFHFYLHFYTTTILVFSLTLNIVLPLSQYISLFVFFRLCLAKSFCLIRWEMRPINPIIQILFSVFYRPIYSSLLFSLSIFLLLFFSPYIIVHLLIPFSL